MFEFKFTHQADEQYAALRNRAASSLAKRQGKGKPIRGARAGKATKDEGLFKQVYKAVALLRENPRHPGLRTHKFGSLAPPPGVGEVFEAYAQNRTPGAYRVFWGYGPAKGQITIIAITPHP